jgi:uncharacterized membrane protein
MVNAYGILKFVHVVSVILWIGGMAALAVVTWRAARERDTGLLASLLKQSTSYGQKVVAPAAGIVLLTGLAMVGMGHIGFGTLWVVWGLVGIVIHFMFGGIVLRRRTVQLATLSASPTAVDAELVAAARSLWIAQLIYLVIMASVVGAMVLKPTL